MLMSRHQNAGKHHSVRRANRSSENVAQLRYLGMTVTYENSVQEELKKGMNSGSACYHSIHNPFCFRLLCK
jgi:hypothetical protein